MCWTIAVSSEGQRLNYKRQGCSSRAVLHCADVLRRVAGEHPGVAIGSYPNVAECAAKQAFRVKLQLESRDTEALERAVAAVREAIECFEPAMLL